MTAQSRFEEFLGSGGPRAGGFPIPKLTIPIARRLVSRIDQMQWYLNCYSLELNFQHAALGVSEFLELGRDWGFDGVQVHNARGGPRVGLPGESDSYLAKLAHQRDARKLDIQLDISSVEKADVEDAVRVARAMGIRVIRCYARTEGTVAEIIGATVEQLKYAAELAQQWGLTFLLEQHELLTGDEVVEIAGAVQSDRLGLLFDFGNPISSGGEPLEDLYVMREFIRVAHCKDVVAVSRRGMPTQLGVKFGQGDLNLPKLFFDLLMLGNSERQLSALSIQEVVGYVGVSSRAASDPRDRVYTKRPMSATQIHEGMISEAVIERVSRERRDVADALSLSRRIASQLKELALDFVHEELQGPELGPEASRAREIEFIGERLFGPDVFKQIWDCESISDVDWETMTCPGLERAAANELMSRATRLKDELFGRTAVNGAGKNPKDPLPTSDSGSGALP